ncbi:MAG: hypothetical protein IIU14_07035 [Ruminococcus sp.]|nr:hypothetical protein [Ruminococcus sp.]
MKNNEINEIISQMDSAVCELLSHYNALTEEGGRACENLGESSEKLRAFLSEDTEYAETVLEGFRAHISELRQSRSDFEEEGALDPILQ